MINNKIILTGTMGSGKTSVINALKILNINTLPEPAREILKEQRAINATGVPEKDPALFIQLLLSRFTQTYHSELNQLDLTLFDRGIPDLIAYANLFQLDTTIYQNASKLMPYNKKVFILPHWPDIYENDPERKMTLKQAKDFDIDLKAIYKRLNYTLIEVPKISAEKRALFIIEHIPKQL